MDNRSAGVSALQHTQSAEERRAGGPLGQQVGGRQRTATHTVSRGEESGRTTWTTGERASAHCNTHGVSRGEESGRTTWTTGERASAHCNTHSQPRRGEREDHLDNRSAGVSALQHTQSAEERRAGGPLGQQVSGHQRTATHTVSRGEESGRTTWTTGRRASAHCNTHRVSRGEESGRTTWATGRRASAHCNTHSQPRRGEESGRTTWTTGRRASAHCNTHSQPRRGEREDHLDNRSAGVSALQHTQSAEERRAGGPLGQQVGGRQRTATHTVSRGEESGRTTWTTGRRASAHCNTHSQPRRGEREDHLDNRSAGVSALQHTQSQPRRAGRPLGQQVSGRQRTATHTESAEERRAGGPLGQQVSGRQRTATHTESAEERRAGGPLGQQVSGRQRTATHTESAEERRVGGPLGQQVGGRQRTATHTVSRGEERRAGGPLGQQVGGRQRTATHTVSRGEESGRTTWTTGRRASAHCNTHSQPRRGEREDHLDNRSAGVSALQHTQSAEERRAGGPLGQQVGGRQRTATHTVSRGEESGRTTWTTGRRASAHCNTHRVSRGEREDHLDNR